MLHAVRPGVWKPLMLALVTLSILVMLAVWIADTAVMRHALQWLVAMMSETIRADLPLPTEMCVGLLLVGLLNHLARPSAERVVSDVRSVAVWRAMLEVANDVFLRPPDESGIDLSLRSEFLHLPADPSMLALEELPREHVVTTPTARPVVVTLNDALPHVALAPMSEVILVDSLLAMRHGGFRKEHKGLQSILWIDVLAAQPSLDSGYVLVTCERADPLAANAAHTVRRLVVIPN